MIFRNTSRVPDAVARPLFEFAERFVFGEDRGDEQWPGPYATRSSPAEVPHRLPGERLKYEARLMKYTRNHARGTAWRSPLHLIVRINEAGTYPYTWQLPALYGHFRHELHSIEETIVSVAAHEMTHILHFIAPTRRLPLELVEHLKKVSGLKAIMRGLTNMDSDGPTATYADLWRSRLYELDTTRVELACLKAWLAAQGRARDVVHAYQRPARRPTDRVQYKTGWHRGDLARRLIAALRHANFVTLTSHRNERDPRSGHGTPPQFFTSYQGTVVNADRGQLPILQTIIGSVLRAASTGTRSTYEPPTMNLYTVAWQWLSGVNAQRTDSQQTDAESVADALAYFRKILDAEGDEYKFTAVTNRTHDGWSETQWVEGYHVPSNDPNLLEPGRGLPTTTPAAHPAGSGS